MFSYRATPTRFAAPRGSLPPPLPFGLGGNQAQLAALVAMAQGPMAPYLLSYLGGQTPAGSAARASPKINIQVPSPSRP